MKSIGIVRRIDSVGRIVLPVELRKTLNIADDSALEIFVEEDRVVLKKYSPSCIFCHDDSDIVFFKGKNICKKCIEQLSKGI